MSNQPDIDKQISFPPLPEQLELVQCRRWLKQADESLVEQFHLGENVDHLVYARSSALDALIVRLWQYHLSDYPDLSLIATGGYGRGELHPYSDIDLLMLLPRKGAGLAETSIAEFLTFLWDLKLDVGHSARTVSDCVAHARSDITVATNLMEMRLLCGQKKLYDKLSKAVSSEKTWTAEKFFQAKYQEQLARHARYNDTAYNLEPNLKEGPGGLRDIQTVVWMATRSSGASSLEDLVGTGFLDHAEYADLHRGRNLLWRMRFGLHVLAKRKEDRLLFDYQRDLAKLFGYQDSHQENLAVEQLMQRYFRTVMRLEQLNDLLVQTLAEQMEPHRWSKKERLSDDFELVNSYLRAVKDDVFVHRPALLIEMFLLIQARPNIKAIHASTSRLMTRSLNLIDDGFRHDSEVRSAFIRLLRGNGNIAKLLSLMHRYGVLGRYLPTFAAIAGRMQYDLFHVYTVDQHTLFVLRQIYRFSSGMDDKDYPLVSTVFRRLPKPELLYLAGFFHDIAKGRGGDHSQLGELDAQAFCEAHGISQADTDLVRWLVRYHLLMSVTAQRQDIADPSVVNRFARLVGSLDYLDYLYLLTIADITATSPKLWSTWKARLLVELYQSTYAALQRGLENPLRRQEWADDTKQAALQKLLERGVSESRIQQVWARLPAEYFLRQSADQVSWQSELLCGSEWNDRPLIGVRQRSRRATTEVFVFAPNVDGCFATIMASLAHLSLNIIDARIFNTIEGHVMDTFQVLDKSGVMLEKDRRERVHQLLMENLSRRPLLVPDFTPRLPSRLRHFFKPAKIAFGRTLEDERTLLELVCSDRPGLLATVARVLLEQNLRIHGAKAATFGDRVEDYFLITDLEDRLLTPAMQKQLQAALLAALAIGMPDPVSAV